MREFTIYVALNKGRITKETKATLTEYSKLFYNLKLNFIWLTTQKKLSFATCSQIISFERKCCTHKRCNVANTVSIEKATFLGKIKAKKYNIQTKRVAFACKEDYRQIAYGNNAQGCSFNSCLCNCIYINEKGKTYICPFKENSIELTLPESAKTIYDIFQSQSFISLLKNTISFRNNCKATCAYFSLCKGGCPLNEGECKIKEEILKAKEEISLSSMKDKSYKDLAFIKASNLYKIK